jgi:hypothetical protein
MMLEATIWGELSRPEQRLLIKLFGFGSTRNEEPAVIEGLCARGLLDNNHKLSKAGLFILTLAMRKQQADLLLRTRLTAFYRNQA